MPSRFGPLASTFGLALRFKGAPETQPKIKHNMRNPRQDDQRSACALQCLHYSIHACHHGAGAMRFSFAFRHDSCFVPATLALIFSISRHSWKDLARTSHVFVFVFYKVLQCGEGFDVSDGSIVVTTTISGKYHYVAPCVRVGASQSVARCRHRSRNEQLKLNNIQSLAFQLLSPTDPVTPPRKETNKQ